MWFQSAPLREGRRGRRSRSPSVYHRSFNPRPCARGDHHCGKRSILLHRVSIRAPARGATTGYAETVEDQMRFQSAPLREGRHDAARLLIGDARVSIRAPARGAT